jgi:hypothetical protein
MCISTSLVLVLVGTLFRALEGTVFDLLDDEIYVVMSFAWSDGFLLVAL